METVLNGYRVKVKKACASCKYKECQNDGTRICKKVGLKVEQNFKCRLWEMTDGLKNAGLAHGVVRKLTEVIIN